MHTPAHAAPPRQSPRVAKHRAARVAAQLAWRSGLALSINPSPAIFIVGAARSGKTLLAKRLAGGAPDAIAYLPEANEWWDPDGYPWHEHHAGRPPDWYDPDRFHQMWQARYGERHWRRVLTSFALFKAAARRRVLLTDGPMLSFRMHDIARHVPDARFIHVARSGPPTVYEWATKTFAKMQAHERAFAACGYAMSFDELLRTMAGAWGRYVSHVREQLHATPDARPDAPPNAEAAPLRGLEVRYEDLCARPTETLTEIARFVDVPVDADALRLESTDPDEHNRRWRAHVDDELAHELEARCRRAVGDEPGAGPQPEPATASGE